MYIVIEVQKDNKGVVTPSVFTFSDKNEAESKYYNVLSRAATSGLPRHGAILLFEDKYIKSESFTNENE